MDKYILDENDCPKLVTIEQYLDWQETLPEEIRTPMGFRLARDEIEDVLVSTVYLGLDDGFGNGPPVLWETMVFCRGENDQDCERSTSRAEAMEAHKRFCKKYLGKDLHD